MNRPNRGELETLPSGRIRIRMVVDGKRRNFGTWDAADAPGILQGLKDKLGKGDAVAVGGDTLVSFGATWQDDIEGNGRRSMGPLRFQWDKYIAKSKILDGVKVCEITTTMVKQWARTELKHLARGTQRNILGYLRQCLEAAVDEGLIETNPAAFRWRRKKGDQSVPWEFLYPDEQKQLLACEEIPPHDKALIKFFLGTGLRRQEAVFLKLSDLVMDGPDPRVIVRKGSAEANTTKGNRFRPVSLFGYGLEGAREMLELLRSGQYTSKDGYAFPSHTGGRRDADMPFGRPRWTKSRQHVWFHYLKAAGITRRVRVHDLRHTCASSLVAGWWTDEPWSLLMVRDHLGHSSVKQTERYAHLAPSVLKDAAARARALPTWTGKDAQVRDLPTVVTFASTIGRDGDSRAYVDSWAPRGLQQAVLGLLRDIEAQRPIQPQRLTGVIEQARASYRAASTFERAAEAALQTGPHQLDRFIEWGLQIVAAEDVPAGLKKAVGA